MSFKHSCFLKSRFFFFSFFLIQNIFRYCDKYLFRIFLRKTSMHCKTDFDIKALPKVCNFEKGNCTSSNNLHFNKRVDLIWPCKCTEEFLLLYTQQCFKVLSEVFLHCCFACICLSATTRALSWPLPADPIWSME